MDYRNNIRLVRKPKSVVTLDFVITMIKPLFYQIGMPHLHAYR